MLFIPKNSKFKKQQKGRSFRKIKSTVKPFTILGSVGLKALTFGRVNSKQLITIKQSINKVIKKLGRLHLHIFSQTPISKKPKEIRMGKGKGAVDHYIAKIKPGTLICEIKTDFKALSIKALKSAQIRLPIRTRIVFN